MTAKRMKPKTGRPVKVPGEKGTKEKIFEAAIDLFAERGYDGVSMRDIGRAVGVTEAAVYKHYSGKEEILDAIFEFVEGRIYPELPPESMDILADSLPVEEIMKSMPRAMMADPQLTRITRIMMIEMYHNEKIRNYVRRELFERPVDLTEIIFGKLMEKGKIKACDARALSTLFISYLIYWYFETFIFNYGLPRDSGCDEKTAEAQIRLIADLVRPDGRRSS